MEPTRTFHKQSIPLYEFFMRNMRLNKWFVQKHGIWIYRTPRNVLSENKMHRSVFDRFGKEWFVSPTNDCVYYNRYTTPWTPPDPTRITTYVNFHDKRVKSAGILLKDKYKNYFVLVQNFGNKWSAPKGSIEPGETVYDAAIREFEEETGIRGIVIDEKTSYVFANGIVLFLVNRDFSEFGLIDNLDNIDDEITAIGKLSINCIKEIDYENMIENKITILAVNSMLNNRHLIRNNNR